MILFCLPDVFISFFLHFFFFFKIFPGYPVLLNTAWWVPFLTCFSQRSGVWVAGCSLPEVCQGTDPQPGPVPHPNQEQSSQQALRKSQHWTLQTGYLRGDGDGPRPGHDGTWAQHGETHSEAWKGSGELEISPVAASLGQALKAAPRVWNGVLEDCWLSGRITGG